MDDEIFMKVIWIISKIFSSPDLLVRGAHWAFQNVFLSIESWAIFGMGWGGDGVKTWCERFPASFKRKKKSSFEALAVWQVCIYSSSDLCNYNRKPSAPTCLLQGCHIQAKSVPGWKENPPFGITGLLGSAAVCPALKKKSKSSWVPPTPPVHACVTLAVICIGPF